MSLDTKEKRLSMLNFGLPWWTTLPQADGRIDADDRLHLLHLYAGRASTDSPVAIDGRLIAVASVSGHLRTRPSVEGTVGIRPSVGGRVEVQP